MDEVIVAGVGNPCRGDDGAGWAVVDVLEPHVGSAIALSRQQGDAALLLELFAVYNTVYLVDAGQGGGPVGGWRRLHYRGEGLAYEEGPTSTHGFGVAQTLLLAEALQALPHKLVLYVIEGGCFEVGATLSPAVSVGVQAVARQLLQEEEIVRCMNTA